MARTGVTTETGGLFEEPQESPIFVHIVQNGTCTSLGVQEVFDTNRYSELLAITFVSGGAFFLKTIHGFQQAEVILGIEDNNHLNAFKDRMDSTLQSGDFWASLDQETQDSVAEGKLSIRYAQIGVSIHSKIYLLRGSGGNRLILGSANFTERAFTNKRQFEEIIIFDDSLLYDVYLERYNHIRLFTDDYIPERLKKAKENRTVINVNDPQVIAEILAADVERNVGISIPEEHLEEIRSLASKRDSEARQVERLISVTEIITTKHPKTGTVTLLPPAQIVQKITAIKSIVSRSNPKSDEIDSRWPILVRDSNYHLLRHLEGESSELQVFSHSINDRNAIKSVLEATLNFVESYEIFTVQPDDGTRARIFEVILYAFMAPYFWRIREHYALSEGRDDAKSQFPPFLVMAGRARSGKTTALNFIGTLLNNSPKFIPYSVLSGKSIVADFMRSENVAPLLVDEVAVNFFTSTKAYLGENLIKDISNNQTGRHPVFIGTTNARDFDVSQQVARRTYYVAVNCAFNADLAKQSRRRLNELMNQANTSLFQDFSYRVAEEIRQKQPFYMEDDPLWLARKIFKDYFKEFGIQKPEWFPEQPFNDYNNRGRLIWQALYDTHNRHFSHQIENDTIYVEIENFASAQSKNDRTSKINWLPPECIKEDSHILMLHRRAFLEFICRTDEAVQKKMSVIDRIKQLWK